MATIGRYLAAFAVLVAATLAAGCASSSARAANSAPVPSSPAPASVPRPAESAPGPPLDAFAEGYRAYRKGDYAAAAGRLRYAAKHGPVLADYALFYLGLAEREQGDFKAAASSLAHLLKAYPQSVKVPQAEVALAEAWLKLGRASEASVAASRALMRSREPAIRQAARMALGRAMLVMGDAGGAYTQFVMLRRKYPRAALDAEARSSAYSILKKHPSVEKTRPAEYHLEEAALLLRERERAMALRQVRAGFRLSPSHEVRAQLVFLEASALRPHPRRATAVYKYYLRLAPRGISAPAALDQLGLIYWDENLREEARRMFGRLVMHFPRSPLAPVAMLRIGRILEQQNKFGRARGEYIRLLQRYPSSRAGHEARFRAPWMYYREGHYELAAASFETMRAKARSASERDMFTYWRARAIEKSGNRSGARRILGTLAHSIHSNYYPALAAMRVRTRMPFLPASAVRVPKLDPVPQASGAAAFHLERALALQKLGLDLLAPGELRALEPYAARESGLRRFVLAGFEAAGAYYEAIAAASRMVRRGQLDPDVAERIRYPRGYPDMVKSAAGKAGIDPYLVYALIRQESMFNPKATSVSNARGLMQLLPATARRMARDGDHASSHSLDLYDPELNVELGSAYLRKLLAMFNGDEIKAVAAYNAGENAVARWLRLSPGSDDEWVENINFRQTREYVKRVIGGRREYRLLYGSHAARSASGRARRSPG